MYSIEKNMKTLLILPFLGITLLNAQVSGNINYSSGSSNLVQTNGKSIDIPIQNSHQVLIEVNGLSNIEADAYIAIFHVTQVGKSAEETNNLLLEKITKIQTAIKLLDPTSEIYVDMLSFVPIYEYEVEKKLFSKNTYNEIPKGFELKKNIHIKYKNGELLSDFISICSLSEIYDLIKVDYICSNLEEKKKELADKAIIIMKQKLTRFEGLLDIDFEKLHKQIVEGYQVFYPVEKYRSYAAFSNQSLDLNKVGVVNTKPKSNTTYYQPVSVKEFDFVVNPIAVEPTIQILYQIKLNIDCTPKSEVTVVTNKIEKQYILITDEGVIKPLPLQN
jgi:hypothetical protein